MLEVSAPTAASRSEATTSKSQIANRHFSRELEEPRATLFPMSDSLRQSSRCCWMEFILTKHAGRLWRWGAADATCPRYEGGKWQWPAHPRRRAARAARPV